MDQCLYMRLMSWAMRASHRAPRAPYPGRLRAFLPFF